MATRVYDRAYNEFYLNNAMNTLATMLDYAVNIKREDIDSCFKRFIDSGAAVYFENGDPNLIAGKSGVEFCIIQRRDAGQPPDTRQKQDTRQPGQSTEI